MATSLNPAILPSATRVTLGAATAEIVTVGPLCQQVDIFTGLTDLEYSYATDDTTTLAPVPAEQWFPIWVRATNSSCQNTIIRLISTVGGDIVMRVL